MAGRLHKKVRGKPVMRGWIALQHVPSGRYLDLLGEELVLVQKLRNTGRWEAWERDGDGVSGLKSVVSRRWIGQSITGKIRCRASAFGSWEEWDITYDRHAPMLCCSANSGGGGWLILDEETEKLVAGDGTLKDKKVALYHVPIHPNKLHRVFRTSHPSTQPCPDLLPPPSLTLPPARGDVEGHRD